MQGTAARVTKSLLTEKLTCTLLLSPVPTLFSLRLILACS